jgi:hypothetical protein
MCSLRWLFFLSLWERIEVRAARSCVTALTLALSRRERGSEEHNRRSEIEISPFLFVSNPKCKIQ